jgi:ABC-type antimicrobial peptide transport system permease subunit
MNEDAFDQNILGAMSLVDDDTNKTGFLNDVEEGITSDYEDVLELPMSDKDLLDLRDEWENSSNGYYPKIKTRQQRNKLYLKGTQRNATRQDHRVVSKNILFEATATFVPAALAENPEPVVFSDNTDEGKAASNDLKTMLQYHSIQLGFRQKLSTMVWQWSEYFVGAVKYGYKSSIDPVTGEDKGDVTVELRKPQNLVLDPNGYVGDRI